jgi:hypothetical protein
VAPCPYYLSIVEIRIVPIREEHIAGNHACLDRVARERRYLAFPWKNRAGPCRFFLRKKPSLSRAGAETGIA